MALRFALAAALATAGAGVVGRAGVPGREGVGLGAAAAGFVASFVFQDELGSGGGSWFVAAVPEPRDPRPGFSPTLSRSRRVERAEGAAVFV